MTSFRILTLWLALGLAALASVAQDPKAAPTKPEKEAQAAEWAELFGGVPLPAVWQSANAAATKIADAIRAKNADGVADWAETVHLASHALEDQVKLDDPDRQRRLKGALAQAAQIAEDVIAAAHHQEPEKLADSFRRMNAALKLAALRLPQEIVHAPPQDVRFAKTAAPAHEEKREPAEKKK